MRRTAAVAVALLLILCCVALAIGGLVYLWRPGGVTKPVVLIAAPGQGEEVRVGEAVSIHAVARDSAKVVRVEFWADGELQAAQNSSLADGISPFQLVAVWRPSSPGTHSLSVRAFNTEEARAYASVSVDAVEVADRDGDGVSDESDVCPDQAGWGTSGGCPDGDGDGIPDADDVCPGEVGVAEAEGCPQAGDGDQDGDGIADPDDACPEQLGLPEHDGCSAAGDWDSDGLDDELDECPGDPGGSELNGCPDLDGDGIADRDDDCPHEAGLAMHQGCPDTDGDTVPDREDVRPEEPGRAEDHGAPDTGAADSDGDGLADDVDRCPREEGLPAHDGCPPPGRGDDLDGDGTSDEDEAGGDPLPLGQLVPAEPEQVIVEVEGLGFLLGQQYDEVACYIGVGEYYERYGPYELEGGTRWDIATDVGGENSVVVETPVGEPLEVLMQCEAYVGEEPPLNLGTLLQEHPPVEWDGRRLSGRSVREEEPFGATFVVRYRVCEGSCEESAFPAPFAWLSHTWLNEELVDTQVVWQWDGDEEAIDYFGVNYWCGGIRGAQLRAEPGDRRISVRWVEPRCEEPCEFYVSGMQTGGLALTPRSNIVTWEGEECEHGRTVTVGFDWFRPIPAVDGRGPIYGTFWANEELLVFDGADSSLCGFYGYECGYYIHGHTVPQYGYQTSVTVGELFHDIRTMKANCGNCSYEAPSSTYAMVPVPEGEDLTIGFTVWEYHREGEDVLLCNGEVTFAYEGLLNRDDYRFPSYDIVVPCRLQISMNVWEWIVR